MRWLPREVCMAAPSIERFQETIKRGGVSPFFVEAAEPSGLVDKVLQEGTSHVAFSG